MDIAALSENDVQAFIARYEHCDPHELMLKASRWPELPVKAIAEQIQSRKRARSRLQEWYGTSGVLFPPAQYLEQASSENTARYKSGLVGTGSIVDLTGGTGIDTFYFSKVANQVTYVEPNAELAALAQHNFNTLSAININVVNSTAEEYLASGGEFEWAFIDPSRRSGGQRVFRLEDCQPNVLKIVPSILAKNAKVMIKLSPLLDIQMGLKLLPEVSQVLVISVDNECKELLYLIKSDGVDSFFKAVNIASGGLVETAFGLKEEQMTLVNYSFPGRYIYEPNASIMKLGVFKAIAHRYELNKLHPNTHLYTSDDIKKDFPGRVFEVNDVESFNWRTIRKWDLSRAHITTRNFIHPVDTIRKRLRIKDGSEDYLFFTKERQNKLICLKCRKVPKDDSNHD